ncbi:MAG: 2,3-bisphosphoglycerate-independent phosphoglycerate mutase [Elusimicrobia bacterium]|nr:2,3-bisphosphoglycerate-independent phosphoglycerate mutase [Elusimicrobiota bacterium]
MIPEKEMKALAVKTDSKIVLLILDGVGGLPLNGKTELEAANKPNLDTLARNSIGGLTDPISPGITPGSGPSHLAIFGYDPLKFEIGRGVLEAAGLGFELTNRDLAARGNFATMDDDQVITDRRAGRIPTEKNQQICAELQNKIKKIAEVEVFIRPGKEHRFVIIFRGDGLQGPLTDADPQREGLKIKFTAAPALESKKASDVVNKFIKEANSILKSHHPANTVLLRGIAKVPQIPSMAELFKLTPACIATYPMYKGLASLVGMKILTTGDTIAAEFKTLKEQWPNFDFFYVHIKKTDSYGEDGSFENKVQIIEELDKSLPQLLELNPAVIAVTGDHSTPAVMKGHSWHPNPFILHSQWERKDHLTAFTENECARGILGRFPATDAMPLMLANALKLNKFGA